MSATVTPEQKGGGAATEEEHQFRGWDVEISEGYHDALVQERALHDRTRDLARRLAQHLNAMDRQHPEGSVEDRAYMALLTECLEAGLLNEEVAP